VEGERGVVAVLCRRRHTAVSVGGRSVRTALADRQHVHADDVAYPGLVGLLFPSSNQQIGNNIMYRPRLKLDYHIS
jgi:hypothetical protein